MSEWQPTTFREAIERIELMQDTLKVCDCVFECHLSSAFSSAESVQQMMGARKAIAAALECRS